MIPDLEPNTVARPDHGLSVLDVVAALGPADVLSLLLDREVERRTDFVAVRKGNVGALVEVRKASRNAPFSPVVDVRVHAGPDSTVLVDAPDCDMANPSALARAALDHARPGALAYVVTGRSGHVNFIWDPQPVPVTVTEIVPPKAPMLYHRAAQAIAFDEDLPPIDLRLEAVDIPLIAAANPAPRYEPRARRGPAGQTETTSR